MHVLITGGSRGIGAACVRAFRKEGHTVTFFYHQNHNAAKSIAAETGATAIACDVADGAAVRAAVKTLDRVDILVNNAGISHTGLISQISEEEWDRLFAVNVKSIYHTVNAVLPGMLKTHSGCILNVSSMWGQVGASMEAAYSATKGAVIALTKSLAKELGPSGIRVNCIAPGVIETDMCAGYTPEDMAALREESPIGRLGTAEDVAQAALYLAKAEFVTGEILSVNGGFII